MSEPTINWYEVIVVDSRMPMDRQHEDEEVYDVLAESEEAARLAISLAIGDRYKIVDFVMEREDQRVVEGEKEAEEVIEESETDIDGFHRQVNAFEVFEEAMFSVSFQSDGERFEETCDSLEEAVEWYFEHPEEQFFKEYPEKNRPRYSGNTDATYGRTMQDMKTKYVHEVMKEVVPQPA